MNALPKQARLCKPAQFQQVFDAQNKIVGRQIVCYLHRNQLDTARLGIVVSKKNFKCAVDRNQLKRWTRELFRQHQSDLQGLDIIVIPRYHLIPRDRKIAFEKLSRQWDWLTIQCNNFLAN